MADRRPDPNEFVIGLTMAGSVSAGAYVAGVLDFLFRALDDHARRNPGWRVTLKVMSGTSGGGTSAALSVAGLVEGLRDPEAPDRHEYRVDGADGAPRAYGATVPALHDLWVRQLSLTGHEPPDVVAGRREGKEIRAKDPGLLGYDDLENGGALRSILDAGALDRAADRQLGPVVWDHAPYDFLADPFDLFITTTSLNGLPYRAFFETGEARGDGHVMARHAFARHFAVRGLGTREIRSDWLEAYGDAGVILAMPEPGGVVDFSARDGAEPPEGWQGARYNWTELRETAMATGAFPIGLPARFVRSWMGEHHRFDGVEEAEGGAWPYDFPVRAAPQVDWGSAVGDPAFDASAAYVASDGGVCNNEPFEYARFTLRERDDTPDDPRRWLKPNAYGAEDANRAVIMIDAFPEGPRFSVADPTKHAETLLGAVAGRLVGVLITQARFKPTELAAASDRTIRSRWMIAPRKDAGHRLPGAPETKLSDEGAVALASGALAGFSGFFDERFRQHDFILGQRNCQAFLTRHFMLAKRNPVFGAAREDAEGERTIFDLSPELHREIEAPAWPRMALSDLKQVDGQLRRRLDKLMYEADKGVRPLWVFVPVIVAVWELFGRRAIANAAARRLEAALLEHGLIEADLDPPALTRVGRAVLAHMATPGVDVHTEAGIAAAVAEVVEAERLRDPSAPGVGAVLEALERSGTERYRARKISLPGGYGWALGGFAPGWLRRNAPLLRFETDGGAPTPWPSGR